jgi:hypothetical protein
VLPTALFLEARSPPPEEGFKPSVISGNYTYRHRVKEDRNILRAIKRMKANWIGHILHRNCLLKHVIEGKIEGTKKRRRRRKQLLDDLQKTRGCWKLKEEALDRNVWRTRFESVYGHVVRQTAE